MKILIPNRGEIVKRLAGTLGSLGHTIVGVYSDADRDLDFLESCDEAYRLPGVSAAETYINRERLLDVVRRQAIEAVHPGYGFLAEDAHFARALTSREVAWLGPSPEVMQLMGDKFRAKEFMRSAGVSVSPTALVSQGEATPSEAFSMEFPVAVKPTGGGGGIGMRIVEDPQELAGAVERASLLAKRSFGEGSVIVEPYFDDARHVEVQLLGAPNGPVYAYGTRDCSIQRRHQKVIEEAVAEALPPKLSGDLVSMAVEGASALGYVGLGTMEFLWQPKTGRVAFLEMNTRLQVEHAVTEAVYGMDLVERQMASLGGEVAAQNDAQGHAIEVRIYAEDPIKFLPSPGTVEEMSLPSGVGLRAEMTYRKGDVISPYYDPLIGKMTVWGPTRSESIERMACVLSETTIRGVNTNIAFLEAVLRSEEFVSGAHTTESGSQIASRVAG